MVPQKYKHFLKRFFQLNPRITLFLAHEQLKKHAFAKKWLGAVKSGFTYHTWREIQAMHAPEPLDSFLLQKDICALFDAIINDPLFIQSLPPTYTNKELCFLAADQIANNTFTILGHPPVTLPSLDAAWHQDVTSDQQSPTNWKQAFYTDICIPGAGLEKMGQAVSAVALRAMARQALPLYPDIKIPWELSRFNHVFIMGTAYNYALSDNDTARAERYAQTIANHITSWLDNNPYLIGVNWVNPMEVAIRSINLLWALYFFKECLAQQRIICALYDHLIYLEHNKEASSRPNNHYMADLVGYLYLCTAFKSIKHYNIQAQKTVQQLSKELKKQILPDQTSYEGSTQYHKLVTEMVLHTAMITKHAHAGAGNFTALYQNMCTFLSDCTDAENSLVQIGDNDSGKIVAGLHVHEELLPLGRAVPSRTLPEEPAAPPALILRSCVSSVSKDTPLVTKTYPNFGLSIIKHPTFTLTFRHATYSPQQPSGHFHRDALAFTLSINGTPVFVDPGTGLYTANPTLRNHLRSAAAHNTTHLHPEPPFDSDLFCLKRSQHATATPLVKTNDVISCQDMLYDYQKYGFIVTRTIECDTKKLTITITDVWNNVIKQDDHTENCEPIFGWSLHVAPNLTCKKEKNWVIKKEEKTLAVLETSLEFSATPNVYSPDYGRCVPSTTLHAQRVGVPQTTIMVIQIMDN